jgi:uncharacterized protein YrrD
LVNIRKEILYPEIQGVTVDQLIVVFIDDILVYSKISSTEISRQSVVYEIFEV